MLSRFTSFVAVDAAEVVNAGGDQAEVLQPVQRPSGWEGATGASAPSRARGGRKAGKKKRSKKTRETASGPPPPPPSVAPPRAPEAMGARDQVPTTSVAGPRPERPIPPPTPGPPPSRYQRPKSPVGLLLGVAGLALALVLIVLWLMF